MYKLNFTKNKLLPSGVFRKKDNETRSINTLIYWERVITDFGRWINAVISPSGRQAIPTPPKIYILEHAENMIIIVEKLHAKWNCSEGCKEDHTVKKIDPATVVRATIYSGKVVRVVHVVIDAALEEYAEH